MTLLELLIVIGIIVALAAVALPNMGSVNESRRTREAARQVSGYFGAARAQALQTGRPCGVLIERFTNRANAGMVLHQVEVPPPYSGDTLDAKCTVTLTSSTPLVSAAVRVDFNPAIGLNLAAVNDQIQFAGQGPTYTITGITGGNSLTATLDLTNGQWVPWSATASSPVIYRIYRSPQKSVGQPLQMPAGTCIDLAFSGTGLDAAGSAMFKAASGTTPVVIMFSGNGSLWRIYNNNTPAVPLAPVFVLVGKMTRMIAPPPDNIYNYQDFDNYWIGLTPQSGMITVESVTAPVGSNLPANELQSRDLVRTGRSKGGA